MIKKRFFGVFVLLFLLSTTISWAQSIQERDVRAHMNFLASDAMKGRESGTEFERIAGEYLASMMRQFGVEPAGDTAAGGARDFIQSVEIRRQAFAGPPELTYGADDVNKFSHGKEVIVFRIGAGSVKGPLKVISAGDVPEKGSASLIRYAGDEQDQMRLLSGFGSSEAAALLIEESPQMRASWARFGSRAVSFSSFANSKQPAGPAVIIVSSEAARELSALPTGTEIMIGGKLKEPEISRTWNAVGKIEGADPVLAKEVILLSAHMDHVGERPNAPGDDKIFNGADDDASGCTAVIELARALASGPRPKRTVYFAFYGSEERGAFGSRYFVGNLDFPREQLVANLQFEMIGRPDPKVNADELWLTGYELSNLGSELAKRGARIVNDPHPEQNFFRRSDNYILAMQGIVAHTVSSYGLHTDYHQPTDDVSRIDFGHMTKAINSMIDPVKWLLNSDFRPEWYEGKDPSQ